MMIFGGCIQTERRRCTQFRNKCFVNRPRKCRLYCISSSFSKIRSCESFGCGDFCAGSPRGCTACRQRMFFKSWRVQLWDRSQERDKWRIVEQIVYNQTPQIQERVVKGCGRSGPNHPKSRCASGIVMPSTDHPDSSENSRGSTSVVPLIE